MAGKTHRVGPSLIQTAKDFASEEQCHNYLEAARWPNGVRCPQCGGDAISKFTVKGKTRVTKDKQTGQPVTKTGPDRFMYQCLDKTCKYQFQTTTGTIFCDTHLPLRIWMQAIALMCTAKKGLSAKQMERTMGVSYKTAWYLNHRIRKAMDEGFDGLMSGTVEADATFIGGRYDERRRRAKHGKQPVSGLLQRGSESAHSKVHIQPIPKESQQHTHPIIEQRVPKDAMLYTDEHGAYKRYGAGRLHKIVVHGKGEYVIGDVHTNGVEGFWSLLKRGIIRSFHQVSVKHLERYIAEFQFRFNRREDQEIFSAVVLGLVSKDALRYKALTAKATASDAGAVESGDSSDEPF